MLKDIIRGFPEIVEVIDILIVACLFYWLMLLFKRTRAERMLWGLALIIAAFVVSDRLGLLTLNWLLTNFLSASVVFIIVVFQKDIRRALIHMGRPFTVREGNADVGFLDRIASAVASMSERKVGALIAIEKGVDLIEFSSDTGVTLDAEVSKEVLLSVFNPSGVLHDGAVIVRNGRIAKAGCILPLTKTEVDPSLGTRHRAALGLSEETDAVILVVSERTGAISIISEDIKISGVQKDDVLLKLKEMITEHGVARNGLGERTPG